MDIIRAFTTNSLHTEIVIKGTVDDPLFRASDVALILEISNIRSSIKDFNESEKVVHTMTTPGGPQNVLFLTQTGLFRLLFRSKTPIALQVQYWACDVVKELQLNQRKQNDGMKLQESIESENSSLNQRNAPTNDDIAKMELENEKLKLLLEMNKTDNPNGIVQELMKMVQHLSSQMERFEKTNKELCEKINTTQIKTTTGFNEPLVTLGPRLQKINPDTMQIIRVYESASEAMKETHDIKRPSLNKAVVENTVYHGYRWAFVDRELDANVIHNLPPTKKTKQQNLGYIAQLNESKTEIRNVYIDRKNAAPFNGYESASALDNPVKQFTLAKGFYYKLYDQCDEALQHAFEHKINGKPLLYKNGVHQCDLQNVVVREFECKYDCLKALSMSDKTLTQALTIGIKYTVHIFKEAGSKLKCI